MLEVLVIENWNLNKKKKNKIMRDWKKRKYWMKIFTQELVFKNLIFLFFFQSKMKDRNNHANSLEQLDCKENASNKATSKSL